MPEASLPKGTRDFTPQVMRLRQQIIRAIIEEYELCGFQPIETPAMENLDTLQGKYGEEGDKLLFKVLNSGDFLASVQTPFPHDSALLLPQIASKGLRYDLTIPFARFVVQHRNEIQFPFRRYQIQPVWRADRPQKGRYREFWQCDADVIGTDSLIPELDLIQIYHRVFSKLNLVPYVLKINHRKLLESIAQMLGFGKHFKEFTVIIDKLDKIGWQAVHTELLQFETYDTSALESFLTKSPLNRGILEQLRARLNNDDMGEKALNDLTFIVNGLEQLQLPVSIELDLSLARGLDYYTGCIFEAIIPDSGIGSVSGGGRYDDLTGIFGLENVSGVGISFGIDRLYDILVQRSSHGAQERSPVQILICHLDEASQMAAVKIGAELRTHGIPTEVYPELRKLKKQMDYANKCCIPYVGVIGSEEISLQKVRLKDMASGGQQLLSINELISQLRTVG